MPTYEYACPKCGHEFEQFQSMRDEPLKKCPKCKKIGLKRLVGSGAGLIFKGTGFYITDYKNKGAAKEGAAGKSEGGSKGEGGGEAAKPANSKPASSEAKTPSNSPKPKSGPDTNSSSRSK